MISSLGRSFRLPEDGLPKDERSEDIELTAGLVASISPDPVEYPPEGVKYNTNADYDAIVEAILAGTPEGEFWISAYGLRCNRS